MSRPLLSYHLRRFEELSPRELHDLLRLRSLVFVVEQSCIYLDLDGKDPVSRHLVGVSGNEIVACARWYWQGPQVRLGRIVVHPDHRGGGRGRELMTKALEAIGPQEVALHGQAHLEAFYRDFGFETRGEPFDEDGIPHLLMVRPGTSNL